MATRTGARSRLGVQVDRTVCRLARRRARPGLPGRPRVACPQAGRDRRLVERLGQVDARPPAARRTSVGGREADPCRGPASAGPGRSSAISCAASRTRQRSIRAEHAGSCSTHRIARAGPGELRRAGRRPTAVPAGSSCAVGSSRTSTVVPIATMLAMATRCCSPPDSANGSRSARWPIDRRVEGRVDPRVHLGPRDAEVLEPERELLADRQLRRRQLVGRRREDDPDPAEQRARAAPSRCPGPRSRRGRRASPGRRAG